MFKGKKKSDENSEKTNKQSLKVRFKEFNNKLNKKSDNNKKRQVVAFDLGTDKIKVAEGSYYKGELVINSFFEISTPKEAIDDGIIKLKDKLIDVVKEELSKKKIKAKYGICTTNSTQILNRDIIIPSVDKDELDTVVKFEIQQYLPINLDESILQTQTLGKVNDGSEQEKMNVRVIAFPKKIASMYYDFLKALQLKPYVLDVNYNALNKIVNYTDILKNEYNKSDGASSMFIDFGASFIDINIYKNGRLDFTRRIKGGYDDLEEALIRDAETDREKVSDVLYKIVDISKPDEEIDYQSKVIKNVTDDWIEKISMVLKYYRNQDNLNIVDKVYILGGLSRIKGIKNYLTERLSIGVSEIKMVPGVSIKKHVNNDEISDYFQAFGAIIRL